ncbi:hypothetical protein [Serratia marcescens]|uniref:hypothetical protein n=1 Tax=Serratia marcescens TaxID=615 RepID=UPI000A18A567|nr:hypothetical protein [Serratia marcescens]MBH2908364.1 hypothetical protein [Serratia marcescens]MBH2910598.1 hypothetical protein [Serratia marcescens]HCU0428844.1 hypothetical protein [Serratia marcescens]
MGPIIVMIILVCGYWYTNNHYQSRVKHARSNGWNSYFQVALHGCKFFLYGILASLVVWIFSCLLDFLLNLPLLIKEWYEPVTIHGWMADKTFIEQPFLLWFAAAFAILISFTEGNQAKLSLQDGDSRLTAYREVAKTDAMENLLIQAIDEDRLIFATLKSRKVYIGYVAAPRFEHSEMAHLSIIPYVSGYRDKDTLRFIECHRYVDHYLQHEIEGDSEPLNLQHFRTIIPMDQIESVSIFDTATYEAFRDREGCQISEVPAANDDAAKAVVGP